MLRTMAVACALGAFVLLAGPGSAADKAAAKNNQMVKGTIKSVDIGKNLLIVNQKVGTEFVERQLSITAETEISVGGKSAFGKAGLAELSGKEGAAVQVKCDKDVNVLKVTAK